MTIDNQIAIDQASTQYSQKPPIYTYMGEIQKEASFDQNLKLQAKLNNQTLCKRLQNANPNPHSHFLT